MIFERKVDISISHQFLSQGAVFSKVPNLQGEVHMYIKLNIILIRIFQIIM